MHDKDLLSVPDVCRRMGGITRMGLHKWRHDPNLKFPPPVKINRRIFWRPIDLDRWCEDRISRSA